MIEPSLRLRRAIYRGDASLVARILKSHPNLLHNPDTTPSTTHTPSGLSNTSLHLAASLDSVSICRLLLDLGHEGTPESPQISLNEKYDTPLHLAAKEGHTDVIHIICERCPTSIPRRNVRGMNALMLAAMGGHDTAVQLLLTYAPGGLEDHDNPNELLNAADHDGNTALHFASMYGHVPVLRTLLAAGANWEKRNGWSWQPVSYSATVQAEVHYKGLVGEIEKRNATKEPQDIKMSGMSATRHMSNACGEGI